MRENRYQYKRTFKIDWLSKIPYHWQEVRLGSLFNERKSKVSDTDFLPLSVTKNGIVPQLDNAAKSNDGDNRKLVLKGDFVINSRSDRKGSSGLSRFDGSVSLINIVLRPIDNIHPKFSEYLLKSYFFKEEYYRYGRGIVEDLWTTRYSEMKNMIIPKPTLEEQTAIARFLDYKLAKINRFIQKKKQLINLLNEQKTAIINQAVTKGLDSNVTMKDSGIEWLGEIPKHWEVTPLKYLLKPNGIIRGPFGSALKTDFFVTAGYKVYEQKNAIYKDLSLGSSYIDEKKFKELKRFEVFDGDFLMSCSGTIGKLHKVEGPFEKGIINQAMMILRIKEKRLISDYFNWLFESEYIKSGILDNSKGSAMKNLVGINEFIALFIPLPHIEDQEAIVIHLNKETKIINTTISKIEKEIALTEEYKTALIAEAVTGKIDVRGYVVPEEEFEPERYEDLEGENRYAAEDEVEYEIEEME